MQLSTSTIFAALSLAIGATAFTCSNETESVNGKAYPYPRCCVSIGRGHGGVETGTNCTTADVAADSNTTTPKYNCANATLSGYSKAACWSGGYIGTSEECFTVIL